MSGMLAGVLKSAKNGCPCWRSCVSDELGGELLIVGAGPSGLALASCCPGKTRIIEQGTEVGGLCRSFSFGGGIFDIGGHSFHTPYPEVARLVEDVMGKPLEEQRRDAQVFFGGSLINYPFQQHVDQIADVGIAQECQNALPAELPPSSDCEDFEVWILRRFGSGVARHFMLPYNRKLWARDLHRMSCEWVGERIVGGNNALSTAAKRDRSPLTTQSMVGYPADGGFGEIFRAMAARAGPIEFGHRLASVDPKSKTARTASGRIFAWDRLVSTIPLPILLECISDCPSELRTVAQRLEAVSLKVVMIAAEKMPGERPQRLYIADPDVPAHKIAFNHQSSSALRQEPREAIMCEVSYSPHKPPPCDDELEQIMVGWLVTQQLIRPDERAIEVRTLDVPFAYPVPTRERSGIVEEIRAYLAEYGIFSIGRFGGWNYANSDACINEAMTLAGQLCGRSG
jgi:protoporphyrinogen oxidase